MDENYKLTINRYARQRFIKEWILNTFGELNSTPTERARRLLEEVIELVQCVGLSKQEIDKLVTYVYKRPVGEIAKEAGQVGINILSFCASMNIEAEDEEIKELKYIKSKPLDYYRDRHTLKYHCGIAKPILIK